MSVLAEVAARADVPVEGVIRVFTRRPVSRRIERRVVEVLDSLDPEQLRTVERLARAGAPNVVPIGSEVSPTDDPIAPALAASDPGTALIAAEGALVRGDDELMVELGRLLSELAVGINEIRQYLVGARQDRVDDLAVLVDLMTTGWQGVDRRLGRLEQMLTRLEAAQETRLAQLSAPPALERPIEVVTPPPPEVPAAAVEAIALPPPERPRRPRWRRLLAPAVPLLLVAVLLLALLASEFMGSSDDPRLQPAPEGSAPQDAQRRAAPQPSLSSTTGGPATEAPPAATTTPPPADRNDHAAATAGGDVDGSDDHRHHNGLRLERRRHAVQGLRVARDGGIVVLPLPHLSRHEAHPRGSARHVPSSPAGERPVHEGHVSLVGSSGRRPARAERARGADRRLALRGRRVKGQ